MLPVNVYSAYTLEPWFWNTPFESGVGGSETGAIEASLRLAKRGLQITSWCPLPDHIKDGTEHGGVVWRDSRNVPRSFGKSVVINYRDPQLFATPKGEERRYFIAQDVDYEGHWNAERLATVDRYICLCREHASYTLTKYPTLAGRVYTSSNGVRRDYLDKHWPVGQEGQRLKFTTTDTKDLGDGLTELSGTALPLIRHPHRLLYASSPDRGLKILLENWFRVRERYPDAELRVAYGFNNMEKIISLMAGGNSWHAGFKQEVEQLIRQEGVTWLGRIPQDKLYEEWLQASVLPYPSSWPETSMVTIMDAMSCGAVPVTSNHWAQGEHGLASDAAYVVDGLPDKSSLILQHWMDALYRCLDDQPKWDAPDFYGETKRTRMMCWARESYDWERIVTQFANWIREDSK